MPIYPPPIDTLETRLQRIEGLIEELKAYVVDADIDRDRRLLEIRQQLDLKFASMLDLLDQIRAKTGVKQ